MSQFEFASASRVALSDACAELSRRLLAGENCSAASFLESYPSLSSLPGAALVLIRAEWMARLQLGEAPSLEQFQQRYPQWHDDLSTLFANEIALSAATTAADRTVAAKTDDADQAVCAPLLVDRYEVGEELGFGAMGRVYKSWDRRLRRSVAVKIMQKGAFASGDEILRFLREARAPARFEHPHLVKIYDQGEQDGQFFYVMQFASGGNLAQPSRRREFSAPRLAARLLEKIAGAIGLLHAEGTIHRDLKPANILFDDHAEPLIADFGLAKRDGDPNVTIPGQLLGTPHYMPPEHVRGCSDQATPASDVWSMGVMLYELLTGQQPFQGGMRDAVYHSILTTEPKSLSAHRPKIDRRLEAIVLKCLHKNPAERYCNGSTLGADLSAWLQQRRTVAEPISVWVGYSRAIRHILASPWLLGSLAIAGFAAALVALLFPGSPAAVEPPSELPAILAQLQAGKPVELVGATGIPKWYQWILEPSRAPLLALPNAPLEFEAYDTSLLELLPDPQCDYFKLRAQVRPKNFGPSSFSFGLFIAGKTTAADHLYSRDFLALSFSNLNVPGEPVEVCWWGSSEPTVYGKAFGGLVLSTLRPSPSVFTLQQRLMGIRNPQGLPVALNRLASEKWISETTWHDLELEITPTEIVAHFDGRRLRPLSHEKLQTLVSNWWVNLMHQPPPVPTLGPRLPVGLFARNGEAQFRNVVLDPVPVK